MSKNPDQVKNLPTFVINKNKMKLIKNLDMRSFPQSLFKEEIVYQSTEGDFLKLNAKCTIVNKLDLKTKHSITVAKFEGETSEKTSENISRVIGHNNYDTVISAILSVINQDLKIRAILALLTLPKKTRTVSCQTENTPELLGKFVEKDCQTDESSIMMYSKEKKHKRIKRRQVTPYVVTETPKKKPLKKIIVHPGPIYDINSSFNTPSPQPHDANVPSTSEKDDPLPILDINENSNESIGNVSMITVNSIPGLLTHPLSILDNVSKVTAPKRPQPAAIDWPNNTVLNLLDGTQLHIPCKIEDDFHVATPEILKLVPLEHRKSLLWYQVYLDWKHCLTPDDEGHLPLHVAAINDDANLVRRQCSVLRSKQESVDITTDDNMTALQISIYRNHPQCTATLLHFGADPLVTDEEYRTCFHLAAEAEPDHLKALVKQCMVNPMNIFNENQQMWKPELSSKPKDYLSKYLLKKISTMFDGQGYTALMLASKLGKHENVKTLLEASPDTTNTMMPNCGNTALYLAVSSACLNASNRGNKSKVSDDFRKTIELLVEYGGDPDIENHSGSNVGTILTDMHVGELSMIIANKMMAKNCIPGVNTDSKVGVIVKDEDGNLNYEQLNKTVVKKDNKMQLKDFHADLRRRLIDLEQKPMTSLLKKNTVIEERDPDIKDKLKDMKEKPKILQNIKIEKDDPIMKKIQIAVPDLDNFYKKEKLSPVKKLPYKASESSKSIIKKTAQDDFNNSFKNFVSDVSNEIISSPVPVTEPNNTFDIQNVIFDEKPNKTVIVAKDYASKTIIHKNKLANTQGERSNTKIIPLICNRKRTLQMSEGTSIDGNDKANGLNKKKTM